MEFEDLSGYDYSNLSPYEDISNFDQGVSEPFTTGKKSYILFFVLNIDSVVFCAIIFSPVLFVYP